IAFAGGGFYVFVDLLSLLRDRETVDERMFRSNHHVGRPEKSVWSRGEDPDTVAGLQLELDLGAFRPSDPGGLLLLGGFRPVEVLEIGEQPFRVGGDLQDPLAEIAPLDGKISAF